MHIFFCHKSRRVCGRFLSKESMLTDVEVVVWRRNIEQVWSEERGPHLLHDCRSPEAPYEPGFTPITADKRVWKMWKKFLNLRTSHQRRHPLMCQPLRAQQSLRKHSELQHCTTPIFELNNTPVRICDRILQGCVLTKSVHRETDIHTPVKETNNSVSRTTFSLISLSHTHTSWKQYQLHYSGWYKWEQEVNLEERFW